MGSLVTWSRPPVGQARPDPKSERRRLDRCDTLSSRLAELHAIRTVLTEAAEVVSHGWVQGAWFTVATPVRQVAVTGACLVGSVVYAAGGPEMARTQLVQRTLDLTWQALHEDVEPPAVACPSPQVRTMRLLDLTHWNDARGRTQAEVVDLLESTEHLADLHSRACHSERQSLAPA